MKAIATETFDDRVAGTRRNAGDEFECDKQRMDELVAAGVARPCKKRADEEE